MWSLSHCQKTHSARHPGDDELQVFRQLPSVQLGLSEYLVLCQALQILLLALSND